MTQSIACGPTHIWSLARAPPMLTMWRHLDTQRRHEGSATLACHMPTHGGQPVKQEAPFKPPSKPSTKCVKQERNGAPFKPPSLPRQQVWGFILVGQAWVDMGVEHLRTQLLPMCLLPSYLPKECKPKRKSLEQSHQSSLSPCHAHPSSLIMVGHMKAKEPSLGAIPWSMPFFGFQFCNLNSIFMSLWFEFWIWVLGCLFKEP